MASGRCGRLPSGAHQLVHTSLAMVHTSQAPIGWFTPREMKATAVERTVADYGRCAALAQEAGYDGEQWGDTRGWTGVGTGVREGVREGVSWGVREGVGWGVGWGVGCLRLSHSSPSYPATAHPIPSHPIPSHHSPSDQNSAHHVPPHPVQPRPTPPHPPVAICRGRDYGQRGLPD